MNKKDKKAAVLALLSKTKDNALIDEIYEILHPAAAIENIKMEELSDELQQKIKRALDDYKTGNYITHGQMKQKMQQLYLNR